jgi:hypothetical protein
MSMASEQERPDVHAGKGHAILSSWLMSRLRPGLARYPAELIFGYDISIIKATTATVGEVC